MRVAFVTPEVQSAYGWARYALDLSRALAGQGVDVIALVQKGGAVDAPSWLADVRPVLPVLMPRLRGFLLRSLLAVERTRRAAQDCDLLHVVAEPYAPLAAQVAGDRPLVVTAHGTYVPQTSQRRWGVGSLYRRAYRRAHLIAVSDYTAGQVRAVLPDVDLSVIRNGVYFDHFQTPAPAPYKVGPTVLASGGVKLRKGTHLLVEALPYVREQVPGTQLVVTGRQEEPAYLDEIRARISRLGLENCVHMVGQIPEPDLRGWYQHADVFALPSLSADGKFEGFGLVFLEASASGLPVIGTTGSGVAEAVIDGGTGLLVPQDNALALADAIIHLLTDNALRSRMGMAGRAYAQTQDWSAVAARVLAVYAQVAP